MITLKQILEGTRPILYVANDEEDGLQFLSDGDVDEDDAAMVALNDIIELDETVLEVVNIQPGAVAFREGPDQEWSIETLPEDD